MTNFYENFNVYSPNRGIIFKLLIIEIEKKNVENIVFRFEFINHCDELVFFFEKRNENVFSIAAAKCCFRRRVWHRLRHQKPPEVIQHQITRFPFHVIIFIKCAPHVEIPRWNFVLESQ